MRIYTFGYWGKDPDELIEFAKSMNAWVADVRMSPFGRNQEWNMHNIRRTIEAVLGPERYQWVKGFGNAAYATGGMRLHNPKEASEFVASHSAVHGDPILVCACAKPAGCHRTVAAEYLAKSTNARSIEHLGFPQKDLFG